MKVEKKGHTTIIKETKGDFNLFLNTISNEIKNFSDQNLIFDVTHDKNVSLTDLLNFKPLSKNHKKGKKSFVIVANDIDFNDVPQDLNIVPSVLEAQDIIEMEEIERDLGF